MARILHRGARERYRAVAVAAPRDRGGVTRILLAVAALAVIAFGPALAFGFVYDDHWTVQGNRALEGALAPLMRTLFLGRGVARGVPDATRPLMVASVWLDRRVFGLDPAGHHLHSLLLYCVCSVFAACAVFGVTRRARAATLGGLVFAAAPIHAEVVAAINYREDLEAGAAVMGLVAWLFLPRRRDIVDHAVLAAAVAVLGLLGKESAIVLLPLAVSIGATRFRLGEWLRRRRMSLTAITTGTLVWGAWRAWLRIGGRDDVPLTLAHRTAWDRFLRTARYAVRAAFDGMIPLRWSPDYAPEGEASAWWLVPLAALVAAVLLLSKRRRSRVFAAGLALSLVAPLATSPLLSPINETADRYVFVATLGGAIVWGSLIDRALARLPHRLHVPVVGAALLPLVIVCHRAIAPFRSDADLWRIATERAPLSARAFVGLARVRRLAGDLDGADRAVERALTLDPHSFMARVTRVYNRLARGDVEAARAGIREIEALGGSRHRGMRRAVRCAALPAAEAARCIDGPE